MSTSTLYHGWGIKGYTLKSTYYDEKGTHFRIEPQKKLCKCPVCQSSDVNPRGSIERTLKTLPIGGREHVFLIINVPRIHCNTCGGLHYIDLKIADARKSYTHQLAQFIIYLFNITTIAEIAILVGLSWHIVKSIVKGFLQKKYSEPDLRGLERISIDEISIGKGHNYLTVVINADTGQPLYVAKGKGESALVNFGNCLVHVGPNA
jgi:transposase